MPRRFSLILSLPLCIALASCADSQDVPDRNFSSAKKTGEIGLRKGENLAKALSRVAARAAKSGNHKTAALFYGRILQLEPESRPAMIGLADAYLATGRPGPASEVYRRALSMHPADLGTRAKLGRSLLALNQPRKALGHLRAVLAKQPSVAVLNDIGVAHQLGGQPKTAQRYFRKVLGSKPANPAVRNNLAVSLALAGDQGGAIRLLTPLLHSKNSLREHRANLAHIRAMTRPGKLTNRRLALLSDNGDARPTVVAILDGVGGNTTALRRKSGRRTNPAPQIAPPNRSKSAQGIAGRGHGGKPRSSGKASPGVSSSQTAAGGGIDATTGRRFTDSMPTMFELDERRLGGTTPRPAGGNGSGQDDAYRKRLLDGIATTVRPRAGARQTKPTPTPYARETIKPTPLAAFDPPAAPPSIRPATVDSANPVATAPAPPRLRIAPNAPKTKFTASLPLSRAESVSTRRARELFQVQLGAYRESKNARAARVRALQAATDVFGGVDLVVDSIDVAGKGRMYRLRTGKATQRPTAEALCAKLKARSIGCFLSATQGG